MKHLLPLVSIVLICAPHMLRAQLPIAPDRAPGAASNANFAWESLQTMVGPARGSAHARGLRGKSRGEFDAAWSQSANHAKQAAQAARAFYTAHPSDPRAPQARKLEVTSLLRGVLPSDPDQGQPAFALAEAYRADPGLPLPDRIEVAVLAEAQRYLLRTNGNPLEENSAEQARIAGVLRAEFGDSAEIAAHHLRVVDTVDPATGFQLVSAVSQMPAIPAVLRQAQTEMERHALLGQPLQVTLRGSGGKRLDLAEAGKVTVVYVWSERRGPADWSALVRARPAAPPGTRWVYLALETTPGEMAAAMARVPWPGDHFSTGGGPTSAALKALKVRRVPFVYVIDADGALSGYGSPDLLPALLHAVRR